MFIRNYHALNGLLRHAGPFRRKEGKSKEDWKEEAHDEMVEDQATDDDPLVPRPKSRGKKAPRQS